MRCCQSGRTLANIRVGSAILLLFLANVTSGRVAWSENKMHSAGCTSDASCSLNGVCNTTTGRCSCLPAWIGPDCGVLHLLPASHGAGLHAPNGPSPNTSSWGGSVAFDPTSGRWQMYAAEMVNGCGIGAWEQNSRIVRASSATGGGVYTVDEVIRPAFAHEPVLARAPNGDHLLYHIGAPNSSPPPRSDCEGGYTPIKGGHSFTGAVPVSILRAAAASGPWTLVGVAGQGDINPAPYIFPNGTAIMMWRGNPWYHVHLATAQQWDQLPYTYNASQFLFPDFNTHGIEDPFVYLQPATKTAPYTSYHAVFHDHSTFGGHAFSSDGVTWTYSTTVPFGNKVTYDDGSSVLLQRRERPHLIFNEHGEITHLTSGVQPPPSRDHTPPPGFQNDYTYTLIQPVNIA